MITERFLKRVEEAGYIDDLAAIVDFMYDVDNAIIQAFHRDQTVATLPVLREDKAIARFVIKEILFETNYSTVFFEDREEMTLTVLLGGKHEK